MDERTRRTQDGLPPTIRRAEAGLARPRSRFWIGVGLCAIVVTLAVYETVRWTKPAPPAGRSAPGGLLSVGAATVALGDVREIVNALGTVTPLATVTVQTQINGQLTAVAFTEGQLVKKGDFLAQVDQRPYEILKEQYEGQLAHDEGLLAQAQMDLTRYQTLAQQNSIAKQQSDDQVFIVQQYTGSVKQDQGLVDAQNLNIAYCHIVSPVTGRVGLRLVDPGNYVQTTATSGIAVITQLQPITVIFSIPEDELPGIMPQLSAGGLLPVTVYDRANLHELAVGQVSAVDNQIDTTTGTVKVRAQFDNTDNKLFPNQFVNARLLVTTLKNVVTVPTSAIQRGSPGAYVYVINADSTVAVRQIVTGVVDGDFTAVNSGLAAGERVVIDGTDRLRDGIHVSVVAENGQAIAPPGARGGGQGRGQGTGPRNGQGNGQAKDQGNQGQRSAQPQNGSPPSGP
jgi:multidrug efflux system membrane fusion protein